MTWTNRRHGLALMAALALATESAWAATSCIFSAVTGVSFGVYNVFSNTPNNDGVGSLSIRCQGGGGAFRVTLSTGQSNRYAPRLMTSGAKSLNYNLYTTASRSLVWGDGTGGSSALNIPRNSTTNLEIFGQIPAGQDPGPGIYADTIVVTVSF